MSDYSQGPGWWQASDGKWYPPQQHPGAAPQAPPSYGQPYGQPYGVQPQESSKATAALVLGIISVIPGLNVCFVPSILAIVFGSQEKGYIGKAKTGFMLGIAGLVLSFVYGIAYFSLVASNT
jgi:hypothetical protein